MNGEKKWGGGLSPKTKIILSVIGILLIIWAGLVFLYNPPNPSNSMSELINDIKTAGKDTTDNVRVSGLIYDSGARAIKYTYVNGSTSVFKIVGTNLDQANNLSNGAKGTIFEGLVVEKLNLIQDATIGGNIAASEIGLKFPPIVATPLWKSFFLSWIPLFLVYGILGGLFYLYVRRQGGGGVFSAGKNQAKRIKSNKKFSDIAGNEEVKEEVAEIVDYLKNPKKYDAAGARVPKGILLGGPPGTGKTLLAKATAGEANVPFFFISGSNFVEMFVGVGAKRVREMFAEARKIAPAIIFIDELDAVGRKRGSSISGGNDEREQTLNQLLVEMDGITENSGLLIMAATNRADVLDSALLRPGRFDRTIQVSLPDVKEREAILKLHSKGKKMATDISFAKVAKRTSGYSGAQLENVVNEASILSVREQTHVITPAQIDEAIDRVMSGPAKKSRTITEKEKTMVAYHEAGHAVVGITEDNGVKVQKITIIPRGNAGGYNLMQPEEETYYNSKSELISMITSFMGGRAAEKIMYGDSQVSNGSANDIEKATNIARKMITEWGMSDKLGAIKYIDEQESQYGIPQKFSEETAKEIDLEIKEIVKTAEKNAIKIIEKNMILLELIKDELLFKETIVAEEIEYIAKNLKRPPAREKTDVSKNYKKRKLNDIINDVVSKTEKQSIPKAKKEKISISKESLNPVSEVKKDDTKKTISPRSGDQSSKKMDTDDE